MTYLCALSFLLTVAVPIVSSYMQNYYKGLMGTYLTDTQKLLEKKHFWSQLGETKTFFYVFLASILTLIIFSLIAWFKNRNN